MNIKDGSNQSYGGKRDIKRTIRAFAKLEPHNHYGVVENVGKLHMWGWLGDSVKSIGWKNAEEKEAVIRKLKDVLPEGRVNFHCGYHVCEICNSHESSFNGSIYIEYKGVCYCCPNDVEHYIEAHDYKPSNKVIEAVLNGEASTESTFSTYFRDKYSAKIGKEKKRLEAEIEKKAKERLARDLRIKRVEESRTPEQKSVLKRFKDKTLDLLDLT